MRHIHRTLAALVACLPALAQAQDACPTGADLATGISFAIDDEATEVYSDIGNGIVSVIYTGSDGYQSRTLLGKGVYLIEIADMEEGQILQSGRSVYSHSLKPVDMPDPKPGARWVSEVGTLIDGEVGREVHMHHFGDLTTLTLGTCGYDMIPVTLRYDDDENTVDRLEYLPELGLALYVGASYEDENGERVEDTYNYFSVKAVPGDGNAGGRKVKRSE